MPIDLLLHALAGYAITATLSLAPIRAPPGVALAAGVGAGLVKELVDGRRFDVRDLGATALGASAAYVQVRWTF